MGPSAWAFGTYGFLPIMALSLYSTPRLRKSEDSPKRYQVTHPSPAGFVSPHLVEKERAQASVHVEDDDSFDVARRTRAAPAINCSSLPCCIILCQRESMTAEKQVTPERDLGLLECRGLAVLYVDPLSTITCLTYL